MSDKNFTDNMSWAMAEIGTLEDRLEDLQKTLESVKVHLLSLKIGKHNPCVETSYPGRCQECEHNRDMDEGIKLIDGSKEPQ